MFKKSEEQEWTRFRGALSKDRDDAGSNAAMAEPTDSSNPAAAPAGPAPASQPAGPSFRSTAADVNVGLPSTRLARSIVSDAGEVESLIGERTTFEGTLRSDGAIRILGSVQGEIQSKGTIIVEDKAHVTARLTAAQVTVAGEVDGQIFCEGRCEIRPTGRVTGEINAGALIIQEGAYFDGSSKMATATASTTASSATTGNSTLAAAAARSAS